jgi:hypothetical protein
VSNALPLPAQGLSISICAAMLSRNRSLALATVPRSGVSVSAKVCAFVNLSRLTYRAAARGHGREPLWREFGERAGRLVIA